MSDPLGVLAHHSESVDPTLWEWIRHQIDEITGLGPGAIVVAIGVAIAAIPVVLMTMLILRRRWTDTRD